MVNDTSGAVQTNDTVVTGMGVVAPTGTTVDAHWQAVLAGKTGISRIDRFGSARYPACLAGQVPDFDETLLPGRLVPQTDRMTHFALYAAQAALDDAAIIPAERPEYEMAVVTASSSGGTEFGQHEMQHLYQKGPSWVSAYQSIAWFYAASTGQISIRHGMRGPCGVFCAEQAGGLDAIGQARRLTREESVLAVTGGTDASLSPYGWVASLSSGAVSSGDDPLRACLPFDAEGDGCVPGEGGAILIAERADEARARGAGTGYGVVLGYAAGFDQPSRPRVLGRVIRRALDDARLAASEVDAVFADAACVPAEDAAEAAAITGVFGPRGVPVTTTRPLTGRMYAGGAPLDVVTALLALRHGVIPHTAGTERLAPECDIDLVLGRPREQPVRTAVVLARGYGGFNAALVLARP